MTAVFKREFKAFFTSPVGYAVMAVLFCFAGLFFGVYNLSGGMADLTGVFSGLFSIVLLLVLPILTMRLFSDDKRQKTDQALLTAPTSLTGIVMGKFLSAVLMFAISLSITIVFAVIVAMQVTPDWMVIIGNFVGLMLLGGMIISIGILISSLTESQFVAALGTFVVSFMLMMLDNVKAIFSSVSWIGTVVDFLSVYQRYTNFTIGVIHYDDIVFFLSIQALFIFLTVRVLDRKRWS